jgi:hypothetical protein
LRFLLLAVGAAAAAREKHTDRRKDEKRNDARKKIHPDAKTRSGKINHIHG